MWYVCVDFITPESSLFSFSVRELSSTPLYNYIIIHISILLLLDTWLPLVLAITNIVAINILTQSFWEVELPGHGCIFNFIKSWQMISIWYSHQECMRVPANPHPSQHLLLSVFLILAIPTCVYWHLMVILIIIYLMTSNFEHIFMC